MSKLTSADSALLLLPPWQGGPHGMLAHLLAELWLFLAHLPPELSLGSLPSPAEEQ